MSPKQIAHRLGRGATEHLEHVKKHSKMAKEMESLADCNEMLEDKNLELAQQIDHLTEQVYSPYHES